MKDKQEGDGLKMNGKENSQKNVAVTNQVKGVGKKVSIRCEIERVLRFTESEVI